VRRTIVHEIYSICKLTLINQPYLIFTVRRTPFHLNMKYTDLKIQTQREFPNNMRNQGLGWLARAGYVTRENELTELGKHFISHLQNLLSNQTFLSPLSFLSNETNSTFYFPLSTGDIELIHCESCKYTERIEIAQFKKNPFSQEEVLPIQKVETPNCNTIESLANFLNIPKEKTAKALMFTRLSDNQFVFVVVRGDMTLSEAKLKNVVGEVKLATAESISKSGAEAGYASPIGLKDALIVVDDLIPQSQNLAAGANEVGYHFINTNYGRDYQAEIVADLVLAKADDACANCGNKLSTQNAIVLKTNNEFHFENILLAFAESYHDEKGLTFPKSFSPFDIYLMHVPGKTINTKEKAEEIYNQLQSAGISVLFDDRDERAGVKFNDADLIGCPLRITIGEKALQNGMVELKKRNSVHVETIDLEKIKTNSDFLLHPS
jgi:prolyl-tRNA synthetase